MCDWALSAVGHSTILTQVYGCLIAGPTISYPPPMDRLVRNTTFGVGPRLSLFPAPALASGVVHLGASAVCSSFRQSLQYRYYRELSRKCPGALGVLSYISFCELALLLRYEANRLMSY
jgi:hypothetical protein